MHYWFVENEPDTEPPDEPPESPEPPEPDDDDDTQSSKYLVCNIYKWKQSKIFLLAIILVQHTILLYPIVGEICKTKGENKPCVFPFKHKGKTYEHCTMDGRCPILRCKQPWCAYKVETETRNMIKWDYCVGGKACEPG